MVLPWGQGGGGEPSGLGWGGQKGERREGHSCPRRRKGAEGARRGRSRSSKAGGHSASGNEGRGAPARASELVDKGREGCESAWYRAFRETRKAQWTPLGVQ